MAENLDIASAATSGECRAYIVGPNHFQNALFAAYIETNSAWKSSVIDSVAAVPACAEDDPFCRRAVLYDCFGMDGDNLVDSLVTELEQLPSEWTLVLFNLERRAGMEKNALELGVQGFFYEDDSIETLLRGLTAVFGGEFWVSRQKMAEVILENGFAQRRTQGPGNVLHRSLTRREVEILGLLTLGATNKVISEKLFISPHTVRTHLNHIFRKLKVSSRLEAMVWAADSLFVRKHG